MEAESWEELATWRRLARAELGNGQGISG